MELHCTTNFCMLTEHLYVHFKRYIINGRVRAPPEFELRDMIPTFQQGAKTNRRALQSKFKSWAKRMTLLNGNLVLSSSGKIIIPKERCEELIMELHYDNHMNIEKITNKIQRKYTWSKKNFGMDLEVVMNIISNNCKNTACKKEVGKIIKTYCKKLFQGFPVSSDPRQCFQDSNFKSAEFYDYSMELPLRGRFSSSEYPMLQNYLSDRKNILKVSPETLKNTMKSLTKIDNYGDRKSRALSKTYEHLADHKLETFKKNYVPPPSTFMERQKNNSKAANPRINKKHILKSLDTKPIAECRKIDYSLPTFTTSATLHKNHSFSMKSDDSSRNSHKMTKSCKKPKNLHEYKKQLIDAEIFPEMYPAILTDPQSQFLSTLDLVPKKLCTKKILSKFSKEQRKKRLMERRLSWFVVERKVLRDRNKLNKRKFHPLRMKSEARGCISKPHGSSFRYSPIQKSQKMRNNFKKLNNITKRSLMGHTEAPRMIKQQLILPKWPTEKIKEGLEIVDIASSDDETHTFPILGNAKSETTNCEFQFANSSEKNGSCQYTDRRLFGSNAENTEVVCNQMFYEQNFGCNGVFGAPNLFFSQNDVMNFPVTNSNPSYQHNESFCINPQSQFPILRPFFIPAMPNSNIAVIQAGSIPMIRPLGPMSSPGIGPYFKTPEPLRKNINVNTNVLSEQSGNKTNDEQCLFVQNENIVTENKESSNINNPIQVNQPPANFKIILVNKTPNKTYLLMPPDCKNYLNKAKKIVPALDRKQPIAPRINSSGKISMNHKVTVAKEMQQRRLSNTLSSHANYSCKQKESKKGIQREMTRLSNWISKLKTSITHSSLHKGVEKFSHRLSNELNVGITLVKGVRNALVEIEKKENIAENQVKFCNENMDK